MGMGFASNYADVIAPEHVAFLAPIAWAHITALFDGDKIDTESGRVLLLHHLSDPDVYDTGDIEDYLTEGTPLHNVDETTDERWQAYIAAWKALRTEFAEATKVGDSHLVLWMGYHDSESNGDRYDEVDGAFFAVEGVYQPTPAGQSLLNRGMIERQTWVTLG